MKTNTISTGGTNVSVIALGVLAALLIFMVLTGRKVPFLASDRAALLVLVVIGMLICSQAGIGRVSASAGKLLGKLQVFLRLDAASDRHDALSLREVNGRLGFLKRRFRFLTDLRRVHRRRRGLDRRRQLGQLVEAHRDVRSQAVLDAHPTEDASTLESEIKADAWAREEARRLSNSHASR